jgi:hypothetical protein
MAGGELVTLAEAAGQAVVTAAATDAWGTVKAGVTRLLGRGDQDNAAVAARRLEDTRSQLAAVAGTELAAAEVRLSAAWQARLADLLEDDPGAVVELRALLADIQAALPAGAVTAAGHAVAAGRDLSITASGGGVAAGTVHGDVSPPGPPGPGPAA